MAELTYYRSSQVMDIGVIDLRQSPPATLARDLVRREETAAGGLAGAVYVPVGHGILLRSRASSRGPVIRPQPLHQFQPASHDVAELAPPKETGIGNSVPAATVSGRFGSGTVMVPSSTPLEISSTPSWCTTTGLDPGL